MSNNYWAERTAKAQTNISNRNAKQIEKQLSKYYANTMQKILGQFELTYNKVLSSIEEGKKPTPADLYKLDSYWKMQAQLRAELEKLGNMQMVLFSKQFEKQWFDIYNSFSLPTQQAFGSISTEMAQQMINQVWAADGQAWSNRIWGNTERLMEELNESLIDCIVAGRKTTDLKNALQERFGVSYSNADMLVRTEIAHIQTQAAVQRYKDYGLQEVEIWADEDERRCDICGKLHQKRYPAGAAVPIPAHPRCRCCVVPVVEGAQNNTYTKTCEECGEKFTTYNEATEICNKCKQKHFDKFNRTEKKKKAYQELLKQRRKEKKNK